MDGFLGELKLNRKEQTECSDGKTFVIKMYFIINELKLTLTVEDVAVHFFFLNQLETETISNMNTFKT